MSSILKVNTIQDTDGNNIINENANVITIGASGDTITVPAGATVSGFTSAGIDDNATSVAITIDSSERVGIGTTTPLENLTVESSSFPIVAISNNSATNPTNGVALDLIERSTPGAVFGQNGVYGFRQFLDASANRFDIISGNQTTTNTRLSIERDTGNIGIGINSPTATLHVSSGNSGVTPNVNADNLFIENNGAAGITIGSSTSEKGNIFFADSGNALDGYIQYAHDTRYLRFATAGSERLRIDSSGIVLVGKTSTALGTAGTEIQPSGRIDATRDGAVSALFNRLTSDGDIVQFKKDGTTVGSIGSRSGLSDIYIESVSSGRLRANGTDVAGWNSSTGTFFSATDNGNDLGTTVNRWNDLYLGGGVYLGGTGSANLLDDYEEGTFTPTIIGTSSTGTFTPNGSYTRGRYTKVGRVVNIYFGLVYSSFTGTGNIKLGGLPFASEDTFMEVPPSIQATGITKPSNSAIAGKLTRNSTEVQIFTYDTASTVMSRTSLAVDAAGEFYFSLTYNTA